jgi:hypothetical protein
MVVPGGGIDGDAIRLPIAGRGVERGKIDRNLLDAGTCEVIDRDLVSAAPAAKSMRSMLVSAW